MRWGMVINCTRCVGCYACVIACKQEHFLAPYVMWNRVLIGESGDVYPTVTKQIFPTLCNHCENPPCVNVCPTGATQQRKDGIVLVDEDRCIGCRSCIIACPYQVRVFNVKPSEYFPGQGFTDYERMREKIYPLQLGTVSKCNFCMERIDNGLNQGLSPGIDREATPTCVNACPTSARVFGDLDDPYSKVSQERKKGKAVVLKPEEGTEPCVYYILK